MIDRGEWFDKKPGIQARDGWGEGAWRSRASWLSWRCVCVVPPFRLVRWTRFIAGWDWGGV